MTAPPRIAHSIGIGPIASSGPGHIATWGGDISAEDQRALGIVPWEIWVIGERVDEGGDGREWICTSPVGREREHLCAHKTDLWGLAEQGLLSNSFAYTSEGLEMAQNCRCQNSRSPIRLRPMPPKLRVLPVLEAPPLNRPCPCGSGRLFKKCEGVVDDRSRPVGFQDRPHELQVWPLKFLDGPRKLVSLELVHHLRNVRGQASLTRLDGATLEARGIYDDGSQDNLSAVASWSTSDPRIASVDSGQVTTYRLGAVVITAHVGAFHDEVTILVVAAKRGGAPPLPEPIDEEAEKEAKRVAKLRKKLLKMAEEERIGKILARVRKEDEERRARRRAADERRREAARLEAERLEQKRIVRNAAARARRAEAKREAEREAARLEAIRVKRNAAARARRAAQKGTR